MISWMVPRKKPIPFGIPRKMSRSSTAYVAQTPPLRKRKKDKKKGMNSTLLVVITVFVAARGEPYMTMLRHTHIIPITMILRSNSLTANAVTKNTTPKAAMSTAAASFAVLTLVAWSAA
uniref:Uncharacterized protein n=1 Tax=Arundo donax TaxID=35708 RepID=A0A0A9BQE0_ARUDO